MVRSWLFSISMCAPFDLTSRGRPKLGIADQVSGGFEIYSE